MQAEECPACGFRSLSGREVRLFDVLFAPQYQTMAELVRALKTAGYVGMFLREDRGESALGFGSRSYVASLDNGPARPLPRQRVEPRHRGPGQASARARYRSSLRPAGCTVKLPKIGEGENGIVYDYQEADDCVLKLAKPRPYSRDHLQEEYEVTEFFAGTRVPVPGSSSAIRTAAS